jgi:hypothetical protein
VEITEGKPNHHHLMPLTFYLTTIHFIERRLKEAEKIKAKYSNERVPVIIEKAFSDQMLPDLEQTKYFTTFSLTLYRYLIPSDFTFQQF